jgi:uncharacterized protein
MIQFLPSKNAAGHETICTRSGVLFDLEAPTREMFRVEDMIFSMGNLARFVGHCEFYSVAQHSVFVSRLVSRALARKALFHENGEPYTNDNSTPMKNLVPGLRTVEKRISALDLAPTPDELRTIKQADDLAFAIEQFDLMPVHLPERPVPYSVIPQIRPLQPRQAQQLMWRRYRELTAAQATGWSRVWALLTLRVRPLDQYRVQLA